MCIRDSRRPVVCDTERQSVEEGIGRAGLQLEVIEVAARIVRARIGVVDTTDVEAETLPHRGDAAVIVDLDIGDVSAEVITAEIDVRTPRPEIEDAVAGIE